MMAKKRRIGTISNTGIICGTRSDLDTVNLGKTAKVFKIKIKADEAPGNKYIKNIYNARI